MRFTLEDNFFINRTQKNIEKTREVLEMLPGFVIEFFVGIQMRTSALTRMNYAYDLRIFFDYLSKRKYKGKLTSEKITLKDLENLAAFDIELYLDYLSNYTFNGKLFKCGDSAKERKLSTLRSFFKYYYKKDKLSHNITTKIDLPKIHDKGIIKLETDEIVKLLNQVESADGMSAQQKNFHNVTQIRDTALLTLFLGTGIRISECIGLNMNDFDFSSNSFIVTRKGGDKSILYFSDEIAVALRKYIEWRNTDFAKKIKNRDAFFLSLQGTRISVRAVENLVKKYSKIISPLKKITPHKLRSTYGTALYRETQDIYVVADVLGHKDVNTTKKHYAAISDDIRRKAAQAVKLRENDDKKE